MPADKKPLAGNWYETQDGQLFLVTAYNEKANAIEIQYNDGTVDVIDLETWIGMEVEEVESPEE